MIWIVKQLISTVFCIQIIKGQKCPKPAIVAGGLFQTGVLPLYHDCTFQSYFTRFWSSNVRDYPLAVEWCHETNEFGDDYLERIYANSENSCGDVIYYIFTWQVIFNKLGLDRTGHLSFLTGQDRTPKFAGQVLPDRTESGLIFLKSYLPITGYYFS